MIDPSADLSALSGTCLFYPCSGADLQTPMALFADKVSSLYFADHGYFRPGHQDTRNHGLDISIAEAGAIPAPNGEWSFRCRTFEKASRRDDDEDVDPHVRFSDVAKLTETYYHEVVDADFRVLRSNDDARRVFDKLPDPLGVFFYRGDSLGEGGSGILWNDMPLMERVLRKLVNGGLLVTDGSNPGDAKRQSVGRHRPVLQAREMRSAEQGLDWIGCTFKNTLGRRLTCIGYAGQRYGATLIWQVVRI